MARIATLDRIVTPTFLKRFQTSKSSGAPSLSSGGASSVNWSKTLQAGSYVYTSAVKNITYAAGIANKTKDSLEKLQAVTDKLIGIAQKATDTAIGSQSRSRLQRQFNKYAEEFREVVKESAKEIEDPLTLEGLTAVLQKIGLDPEKSATIAESISRFLTAEEEGAKFSSSSVTAAEKSHLAADGIEKKNVRVPKNLYGSVTLPGTPPTIVPESFTTEWVTNGAAVSIEQGVVSAAGALALTNPSLEMVTETYRYSSLGGATADPGLAGICEYNQSSGYMVISSTADYLGQNPLNNQELFIVDGSGNVLHQLTTDNTGWPADVAISDDGHTVIFTETLSSESRTESVMITVGNFGEQPGGTRTVLPYAGQIESADINSSGDGDVAATSTGEVYFRMNGILDVDLSVTGATSGAGFISSDTIAFSNGSSIYTYTYANGGSYSSIYDGSVVGDIATLENGYIGFYDGTDYRVIDSSGSEVLSVGPGDVTYGSPKLIERDGAPVLAFQTIGDGYTRVYEYSQADGLIQQAEVSDGDLTTPWLTTAGEVIGLKSAQIFTDGPQRLVHYGTGDTVLSTSRPIDLIAVEASSGYTLIQSSEDLIAGQNALGVNQLFLLDAAGNVLHQVTDNSTASMTFANAAIAADGKTIAYSYYDGSSLMGVDKLVIGTYGAQAGGAKTSIVSAGTAVEEVEMTRDGRYVAWRTSDGNFQVYDSSDAGLTGISDAVGIGFLDDHTLAVLRNADLVGNPETVQAFDVDTGTWGSVLFSGGNLKGYERFTTLEKGSESTGYFVIDKNWGEPDQNDVYLYDANGTLIKKLFEGDASNSTTGMDNVITLAHNGNGGVVAGIMASAPSIGVGNPHLYKFEYTPEHVSDPGTEGKTVRRFSSSGRKSPSVLKGNILNPVDAYKTLQDLKTLKEQLVANVEAVDDLLEVLDQNFRLARAAYLAMSKVESGLKGSEDAEKVAALLRERIRSEARTALSQAENLDPLAAAALALYGENN